MGSFDEVGIEFDAAVVEETGEPIPVMQGIADGFGDWGLSRDASELSTWCCCGSGWRGAYRYAYAEGQTLSGKFNSVSPDFALRER